MPTVTRPDGSKYFVSARVTYFAIGWVTAARRGEVVALLNGLFGDLRAGRTPEQAAQPLEEPVRSRAIRAGSLIRHFESIIGMPSTPVVEEPVRTPERADSIGIFSGGPYSCEIAADLGDQVARALAELLLALGAIEVLWWNYD